MLGMLLMAVGMIVGPNDGLFESALDAFKRLAAAAAVDPAGSTAQERADRKAGKADLDVLIAYVEKCHALKAAGEWNSATMEPQYLTVLRDLINTGTDLAVLPEEKLAWQRIGLVLSFNLYCRVWSRVQAGVDAQQYLSDMRVSFERFRRGYQAALTKYAPPPR